MKGKFWQENCYGRNSDVMFFVRFLKEHRAYKIFLNNLDIITIENKKYAFEHSAKRKKLFKYPPRQWIIRGFYWRDTAQGHFYWSQLHRMWENACLLNGIFNKGAIE